jgi:sugar transferase (PEP-CTERM/EpsH1 system associated)
MKVLVVLSRVPYPLDKGDKLRAYNQLKELSKKHQLILFALNDSHLDQESIDELKKYCVAITIFPLSKLMIFWNLVRSFFNGMPFQVGYFYSKKAQEKINGLIEKHQPDHIYCQLIRTAEYAKSSNLPKTLDYMDVFSKGIERRIEKDAFYMKPILKMEYKRLLKYESDVFDNFTNKVIISEQDRAFIPHKNKGLIQVISNGIDTDFFKPIKRDKEFELLFNGNMNYPPNIESAEFLVNAIMPLVWAKLPTVRLLISGTSPNEKVLDLASDKVIISGWVEDVRENYSKSKILVAPMQISIGLQNKLLEAMAMQLPCITSSLANNALKAKPGEQILVADQPQEYADLIIDLLTNDAKALQIAKNGYHYVTSNFNWSSSATQLSSLFAKGK